MDRGFLTVYKWWHLRYVVLLFVVLFLFIVAGCGAPSAEIRVPVIIEHADDVGSLHLELVFDPDVLKATGVETEKLADNALIEYNLRIPGRVIIGVVDASGISGDGTLVEVAFDVIDNRETSRLLLEDVEIHNAAALMDISYIITPGSFSVKNNQVDNPIISLIP